MIHQLTVQGAVPPYVFQDVRLINAITGKHGAGKSRTLELIKNQDRGCVEGYPVVDIMTHHPWSAYLDENEDYLEVIRSGDVFSLIGHMKVIAPRMIDIIAEPHRGLFYRVESPLDDHLELVPYDHWNHALCAWFDLVLRLMTTRDSLIIIDDFGLYFHPYVMPNIMQTILDLMKENHNQLILTTVQESVIHALASVAQKHPEDVAAFHIGRSIIDGSMLVSRYSGERLNELDEANRSVI